MFKKIWVLLLIGLLIRIFLAATSYHPDIQAFAMSNRVITQGNVLNFYDYLYRLPADSQILKSYPVYLFNYPPAIYFYHASYASIFNNFFDQHFLNNFLFDYSANLGNIALNFYLLLIKIPYLIFDFGIIWLFWKLFEHPKQQILAVSLWLFNPLNLYATYMMGQYDIISTFFIVLAIYLVIRQKATFKALINGSIALGVGASFKIFPLFLLIPLAAMAKSWWQRVLILVAGVVPYFIFIAPFLGSKGFRSTALVAGQTLKSFYGQLPISGGEAIIYFISVLGFFYLIFLLRKGLLDTLWERFFLSLLVFFVFTHTHPQWLLWLTPFLVIDLVLTNCKHWLLTAVIALTWLAQLFFFDAGLTIRLFSPIFPDLVNQPEIWKLLNLTVDINFLRSVLQSLFVATALYYFYYYFPKKTD